MPDPERFAGLVEAARQRRVDTRRRVVEAMRRLDSSGESINFAAVAEAAGVSRAFLYRQPDLRAEIENLRRPRNKRDRGARPLRERATPESLRQELEALRAREAELRAENRWLREAVVRGHAKVPAGGQVRSPLVANKSPRLWPKEVPAPH